MIWPRLLPLVLALAAACSQVSDNATPVPAREPSAGLRAYENVCAACHEQGVDGAPATSDREAWADRSSLWVAVLEEHAKAGYLNMPARGGDPALSDEEVSAAAMYMLTLTHPEQRAE